MTENRLLVCVSASGTSADLVRRGAEIARTFGVEWIAVHVQNMSIDSSTDDNRERAFDHLQLAEELGAHVEVLSGRDVAATIVDYALRRHVSRIVIGKRAERGLRRTLRRSIAARLVQRSGKIEVYVLQGEAGRSRSGWRILSAHARSLHILFSILAVAAATGLCMLFARNEAGMIGDIGTVAIANIVMIYLAAAFAVAVLLGWIQGVVTSILAVLAFNFFFTEPRYTFVVYDPGYLVTFVVMLLVTLVSSSLAARVRSQAKMSKERERRTRVLYEMSRRLTEVSGEDNVCEVARSELSNIFGEGVSVVTAATVGSIAGEEDREAALWCVERGLSAGIGTENLADRSALYLPLQGRNAVLGVVIIRQSVSSSVNLTGDRSLLAGMASLIAFALEREQASMKARDRLIEVENEKMRNALLRGISHDLRTPLAAIAGSATTLLHGRLDDEASHSLVASIADEAQWMSRVVENMLHATRLEAGGLGLSIEMETIDDLVTSAVDRMTRKVSGEVWAAKEPQITVSLPQDVLVAPMDLALMEQVLINLLDNAMRYSPAGSRVQVSAQPSDTVIEIIVEDEGSGIPLGEQQRIFEKFFRGESSRHTRGSGLGLWISSAIVKAHQGRISVENREEGGSRFKVVLPRRKIE